MTLILPPILPRSYLKLMKTNRSIITTFLFMVWIISRRPYRKNIKSNFDINYSDRFTESEVALNITRAITTLKDSGYMNASFDSTLINIDTAKATTSIYIYLYAGSRYKLSEINIVKTV